MGNDPSFIVTVYVVPGVLFWVPVSGNVSVAGVHNPVVPPGFPKPIAGLEPLYMEKFFDEEHPFRPTTVSVMVKLPCEV